MTRPARIVARRLAGIVPVAALVVVGTFLLLEAAPGDAVDAYLASTGGDRALVEELRRAWGLDAGVGARLWLYVASLARGDLGWSVAFARPVSAVIAARIGNTLLLMGLAVALAFFAGSLLGVLAGGRPGSAADRVLSLGSLALYAVPGFWLGLVLIVVFSVKLRWLPGGGIETVASGLAGIERAVDIARHLVLPVGALGAIYLGLYLRLMRAGMVEIWRQDFVRAAFARGVPRARIVWRHVARNAMLPLVTMLGLQAAALLGGSVVVESVFAIPGLGRLAHEAVVQRDTPLLLGVILTGAGFVVLANLVVDILYAVVDPRVGAGPETAA
jgi:peptide/nickel transport system permease protein